MAIVESNERGPENNGLDSGASIREENLSDASIERGSDVFVTLKVPETLQQFPASERFAGSTRQNNAYKQHVVQEEVAVLKRASERELGESLKVAEGKIDSEFVVFEGVSNRQRNWLTTQASVVDVSAL